MKYFYTDPLASAWMQEYYDMLFDVCPQVMARNFARGETICQQSRFYIHPDSLHLLEPQVGDIFINVGSDLLNGVTRWESPQKMDKGCLEIHNKYSKDTLAKIIQRNGIAFMWPEVE